MAVALAPTTVGRETTTVKVEKAIRVRAMEKEKGRGTRSMEINNHRDKLLFSLVKSSLLYTLRLLKKSDKTVIARGVAPKQSHKCLQQKRRDCSPEANLPQA
jgi:hypothetical protein